MRKYIILLFVLFSATLLRAENASNIRVRQEGKNIVITYDLSKKSNVRVGMATGNSTEFKELKAVSGDLGKGVSAGTNKQIVFRPLDEYEKFLAQNVRFKVVAQSSFDEYAKNWSTRTMIIGQFGYSATPQLSYGLMFGQLYYGMGWYVNARSNFNFNNPAQLSCDKNGSIDGITPFYSGNTSLSHLIVNVGFMWDILDWESRTETRFEGLGFYVGGGYGRRELQWEIVDGTWVKYAPTSHTGFSGNIGVFGSILGVTINIGVNTINFKYVELEAGVGVVF